MKAQPRIRAPRGQRLGREVCATFYAVPTAFGRPKTILAPPASPLPTLFCSSLNINRPRDRGAVSVPSRTYVVVGCLKAVVIFSCDHPLPSLYIVLVSRTIPTFPGQLPKFKFPEFLCGWLWSPALDPSIEDGNVEP